MAHNMLLFLIYWNLSWVSWSRIHFCSHWLTCNLEKDDLARESHDWSLLVSCCGYIVVFQLLYIYMVLARTISSTVGCRIPWFCVSGRSLVSRTNGISLLLTKIYHIVNHSVPLIPPFMAQLAYLFFHRFARISAYLNF